MSARRHNEDEEEEEDDNDDNEEEENLIWEKMKMIAAAVSKCLQSEPITGRAAGDSKKSKTKIWQIGFLNRTIEERTQKSLVGGNLIISG